MWEPGERSARGAGRRYVEDSSTGGIRRCSRPGIVSKVLWGFVIVVCAAMAVYSVIRLHSVRSQRQPVVMSRLDDARSASFPDVTVCKVTSVSEVLTTVIDEQNFLDDGNLTLWLQFQNDYLEASSLPDNFRTEAANRALRHRFQTLVDGLTSEQRLLTGDTLKDLLADCTVGDAPCTVTDFRAFYHHQYGNCFTFSANTSQQSVWTTGPQPGLTLDLINPTATQDRNGEGDGGVFLFTLAGTGVQEEAGFVVSVHDPQVTAFTPQPAVFVPEGRAAYLAVTKSTTINPLECADDSSNNLYAADANITQRYSLIGCQHGCLQKTLFERCGCCDLDLPCPASFLSAPAEPGEVAGPRCSEEEELCRPEVLQSYTDGSLACLSECLPPCRESSYSVSMSLTSLTSSQVTPNVNKVPVLEGTRGTATDNNQALSQRLVLETPSREVAQEGQQTDQQPAQASSPPLTPQTPATPLPVETPPPEETPPSDRLLPSRRKRNLANMYDRPTSQPASVRVHVYFDDLRTRTTETVSSDDDWSEWLAAVGGLFSLWLGLSILGVVEVLHLLVELFALVCKCCQPRPASVKPFVGE